MAFKADAAKIKRWREERHWSQEHLAELAGIGLRTLQRIEKGEPASKDTLMALAAAFGVEVLALCIDPEAEAAEIVRQKDEKVLSGLRLSVGIHLAGYVIGMAVFAAISIGINPGYWVMKWPTLWWTVGMVAHGGTLAIVELALRFRRTQVPA
ncbi:MAG: XRE family transcriptional regulator [Maricaulis sp.]|nr:XRE family transcriptional regulator [Maricaulis sp.]|tara:strand:+ start:94 stop:552 length:459 start_codon:yes stop_codon:yes gene_type:complete